MSLIEKESFNCPYCGLVLEDPEGYAFHVETHLMIQKEDEELAAETSSEKPEIKPSKAESTPSKEKEELSDLQILAPIKITVLAEEAEMKEYGYKAPKVPEQLAKEDLNTQVKSWFIRGGMVQMSKFLLGLEDWDKDNYYTPYRKEFDPSQYRVFDLNLEIKDTRTKEEAEKLSKELEVLKEDFSPSDLKKALKPLNQFDEKIKEELSRGYYYKLGKQLLGRFLASWDSESRNADHNNPSHRTQSFNNQTLLMFGKPVFLQFKCPEKTCNFNLRGKKNMSSPEKYAILLQHYDKEHLAKLEGRVHPLSVMKRVTDIPAESEEALLARVRTEEFKVFPKPKLVEPAPNPEQTSKHTEKLGIDSTPKHSKMDNELVKILGRSEKAQKTVENLAQKRKKATKENLFLKAVEAKSSETRRKGLHKEKE